MKIILVDEKHGASRSLIVRGWMKAALGLCLLGLPVLVGYYGYHLAQTLQFTVSAQALAEDMKTQKADLVRVREAAVSQLQALTIRLANLQARLIRLDALGERLTKAAGLDDGEFNFRDEPSVGGPEVDTGETEQIPDLISELDRLSALLDNRQQQLDLLDGILVQRQHHEEFAVEGRPVKVGYVSSGFGRRLDPFTGQVARHEGVDFATGTAGVNIFAVAAGIVTFAGESSGYGKVVKIDHGDGLETLYGHDQTLLVQEGDVVKKGQVIALSGSTGRTTGPHVHFEVHKNGRVVDPASYIRSTIR
ncbi:MAG: M23 family metallopeptidase [Pseudomonadales bacterium]|jgi:murein DD-endopeptidase MepM/ murein hydrolase activator NlpD|nr:M23 family metallopeptidase [Pseudomonadales bacterium]